MSKQHAKERPSEPYSPDIIDALENAKKHQAWGVALRGSLKYYMGCPSCGWREQYVCVQCGHWRKAFGVERVGSIRCV